MECFHLNDVDVEDIEDLLVKVEGSFHITFADNELAHIITFGELCDHIIKKVQLNNIDDCTSQQAFYKLRQAVKTDSKYIDITPYTLLTDILPRQKRISTLKQIEKNLGFKLSILRPSYFVSIVLVLVFLTALGLLYFNWRVGLLLLIFYFIGINLAEKLGKELNVKTVRELVVKMTRENYLNSRSNSESANKKEIEILLKEWFVESLGLEPSSLTRESKIRKKKAA